MTSRKISLIVVALLVPLVPFLVLGELPGLQWVRGAEPGEVGVMGALVLASDVFLPIPSTLIGSYLGFRLGATEGFLWCWLGLCVGNLLGWLFGRASLSWVGEHFDSAPSALLLLATRPLPLLAEAVLIATGAAGVPLGRVFWPIVVGNAVFALGLAVSGAALHGADANLMWLAIPLGLPLVGLGLLRGRKNRSGAVESVGSASSSQDTRGDSFRDGV